MGISPGNFCSRGSGGTFGVLAVSRWHSQAKKKNLSFPSTILKPCCASVVREGGEAGGAAAGIWDWDVFRNAGFVPFSHPAQESFSVEIQRKIHLFKDTVRVLLTLVRIWNVTHNLWEIIPFQRWIQLLSSSTFILQCLVDVEDESALGLSCSSLNF